MTNAGKSIQSQCNTRLLLLSVILFSIVPLIQASASSECVAQTSCPQPAAYGRQPYLFLIF